MCNTGKNTKPYLSGYRQEISDQKQCFNRPRITDEQRAYQRV